MQTTFRMHCTNSVQRNSYSEDEFWFSELEKVLFSTMADDLFDSEDYINFMKYSQDSKKAELFFFSPYFQSLGIFHLR